MAARLRRRLTFANVVSVVALFVALGGSSYAALKIGSGDVRNRSLRAVDIRRNALTGVEIRERLLGKVPAAGTADNALTAGSADKALSAGSADKALSAGSADAVGGIRLARVDYQSNSSSDGRTVIDTGGLVVDADCPAGAVPRIIVKTRVDHAHVTVTGILTVGTTTDEVADDSTEDQDFLQSEDVRFSQAPTNVTVAYSTQGGSYVTALLHLQDGPGAAAPNCVVGGTVLASP